MKRLIEHKGHCLICNIFSAAIALFLFAPVLWWSLDREPAYMMFDGTANYAVKGKSELAMDIVWGRVEIYRTGCHGTFQRELEDETGRIYFFNPMPSLYTNVPIATHKDVHSTVPWEIPAAALEVPGKLKMRSRIRSSCNPVQDIFPVERVTKDVIMDTHLLGKKQSQYRELQKSVATINP